MVPGRIAIAADLDNRPSLSPMPSSSDRPIPDLSVLNRWVSKSFQIIVRISHKEITR